MLLATLLATLLAQDLTPPPPPPSVDPEVPQPPPEQVRDERGVALTPEHPARVRVSLTSAAPAAELYDVVALQRICRAPCNVWLNTDETRRYEIRAPGVTASKEFGLSDFTGDVTITWQHRNETMHVLGLVGTIVGAVGVIGGAVLALGWLIVIGLVNLVVGLFGGKSGFVGAFEVLGVAGIAALTGGAFLTPGLILLLGGGRERLSIDGQSAPSR